MIISAHKDLLELLNSFRVGVISAQIRCTPSSDELVKEIDNSVFDIKSLYTLDEIRNHKVICETREAYKKAGNDPNRYRPSADSLLRRIVKGYDLYRINNVVDTLNLTSIRSGFSIGGYDLDKIERNIELGIGRKDELYFGIGRGEVNIHNLIILRDNSGAFGSPTTDSERTMITDSTSKILFVFFDFGFHKSLQDYLDTCAELLKVYCDASELSIQIVVL